MQAQWESRERQYTGCVDGLLARVKRECGQIPLAYMDNGGNPIRSNTRA